MIPTIPVIPALSFIIGSYVILRCFEIMAKPQSAFATKGVRVFMTVVAVAVILIAVFGMIDITYASSDSHIPGIR